jgi:hypothetical protein
MELNKENQHIVTGTIPSYAADNGILSMPQKIVPKNTTFTTACPVKQTAWDVLSLGGSVISPWRITKCQLVKKLIAQRK